MELNFSNKNEDEDELEGNLWIHIIYIVKNNGSTIDREQDEN